MPRLLALDWTRREARYVLANSSGDKLVIQAAGAIDLADLPDEEFADPEKLGQAIRKGLSSAKPGRANTLVGVDRKSVELLEFAVPAVPDKDLPGIVNNLAHRESAAVTDESIIDFTKAAGDAADSGQVTAAAMTADEFQRLKKICDAAKISPERFVLRPYATAALLPAGTSGRTLLVNRIGEDADLTVVDGGCVVFSRSVRLLTKDDPAATTTQMLQEIRRTLMVAPHSPSGADIKRVYLIGSEQEQSELLAAAQEAFASESSAVDDHTADVEVSVFDVFALSGADRNVIPEHSGRYASLLGMIRTESQKETHPFDFLNPRKPPKPPNRRRLVAMVGGLAAVALFVLGYPQYESYQELVAKNDKIAQELREMKQSEKTIKKQATIASAISGWEEGSINWLKELQSLSERFPSSRDAMVLRMSLSSSRVGTITFNGLARDPAVVTRMERDLRDATHEIQTPRVQERVQENGYTWQFDTKITISKAKPEDKKKSGESDKNAEKSSKKQEDKKSADKEKTEKKSSESADKTDEAESGDETKTNEKPTEETDARQDDEPKNSDENSTAEPNATAQSGEVN